MISLKKIEGGQLVVEHTKTHKTHSLSPRNHQKKAIGRGRREAIADKRELG